MAHTTAIEEFNALGAEELARRLSGPRDAVAAFVAAAAEAGSAEAQARYGQMLLDGDGVAPDPAAGFAWFERAAQAGHLEAANMVGRCTIWAGASRSTRSAPRPGSGRPPHAA